MAQGYTFSNPMNRNITILIPLLVLATSVQAQTVATCEPAKAEAFLDVNNVRARIFNNGALFWKGSPYVYEVPKYGNSHAIFAASIWIAGTVNNEVRSSAVRYGSWEMWPGPLDDQGNPPADCADFDRIYNVYLRDISDFEQTGVATDDLLEWPWELGAPVVDGDGDPENYNLEGGDRPEIMGHHTLWWVMNDRGNVHESSDTDPIGIEVQVTAFAAASENEHIDNATLYRYKIIYKGDMPYEDAYFGVFQDVDLGNFSDDYVGSDTTLGMGYVYNADNDDEGDFGYGVAPPAVGFDVIQGPLVNEDGLDNDKDGEIDELNERLSMTTFLFFHSGGDVNGDPQTGADYYNYMQGRWKDGLPFTVGGYGRNFSNIPTKFFFPDDPVTGDGWSELNPDPFDGGLPPNAPSDRRSAVSTGPFTMQPGDVQEIVIAIAWARGSDNLDSVTRLREASVALQNAFDTGFDIALPSSEPLQAVQLSAPANGVTAQPTNPTLQWQPLDALTRFDIELSMDASFLDVRKEEVVVSSSFRVPDLAPMATYFWRVRAVNAGEKGPWSETWQFSTSDLSISDDFFNIQGFMTVQNAAGPIEPADMGAFAINNAGFPILEGTLTPEGAYPEADRPTSGIQQSTNASVWGIHTGGENRRLFDSDDGSSFLERSIRNRGNGIFIGADDYEWRFTQSCLDSTDNTIEQGDCLAWRTFEDDAFIEVPFELWNIGTLPDTTDDYRMIPIVCGEACGAGLDNDVFDIGQDHAISDGEDDPFTDWTYWYNPKNISASSGQQGYDDFFFGDEDEPGEEVFGRTVLVQLNGGSAPPYDVALPEPGTTFRIVTNTIQPPLLSAPVNREIRSERTTTLYWNGPAIPYHLQIDTSPDFLEPDLDIPGIIEPSYTTGAYPINKTYYWRVRMLSAEGQALSEWSETWQFTIPLNVGAETDASFPTTFSLDANYPNPFQATTRIRYALPVAAEVHLEVFDTLGRRVSVLQNQNLAAGWHETLFDASRLSSGVYFYRLRAGAFTDTRTMIVMR